MSDRFRRVRDPNGTVLTPFGLPAGPAGPGRPGSKIFFGRGSRGSEIFFFSKFFLVQKRYSLGPEWVLGPKKLILDPSRLGLWMKNITKNKLKNFTKFFTKFIFIFLAWKIYLPPTIVSSKNWDGSSSSATQCCWVARQRNGRMEFWALAKEVCTFFLTTWH